VYAAPDFTSSIGSQAAKPPHVTKAIASDIQSASQPLKQQLTWMAQSRALIENKFAREKPPTLRAKNAPTVIVENIESDKTQTKRRFYATR